MQIRPIIKIFGLLVAIFGVTMIPPAIVSIIYTDGSGLPFVAAFYVFDDRLIVLVPKSSFKTELRAKEGFLVVVLFWFVLGSFEHCHFYYSNNQKCPWLTPF